MTDASRASLPYARPAIAEDGLPSDAAVRRAGRPLIFALYGALRAVKLYPVENVAVEKALAELTNQAREINVEHGELELRLSGEFLFVNETRLRLDLENFASFSHLLALFRAVGVGTITIAKDTSAKDWLVFLSLLQTPGPEAPSERFEQLVAKLAAASVRSFVLEPPVETGEDTHEKSKERAKRTYAQSVVVTKELMTSIRMGAKPNIKKVKRLVQNVVEQILTDESSLIGLTTIRDYDEYTFTHSINVCIFAVALGKRLGLSKLQLYDLGLAALFHDIGKSRVPADVLNKVGGLTDDEWRMIASHPWLGVLALFQVRGAQELPYRSMIVALEHHMKPDLTGYPRPIRPRQMGMYSKIVAVADGFDAATSRRAYQDVPLSPAQVLVEMRDNARRGMDQVIVKAFINLTGIYPVGTLVVLDTFELGVVHAVNPIPDMLSRPIVRVISDRMGNLVHPGELVDLADQNAAGVFLRTIIKTETAERYGIRIADYFV